MCSVSPYSTSQCVWHQADSGQPAQGTPNEKAAHLPAEHMDCQYARYFIARGGPSCFREGSSSEDGVTGLSTSIVATFTT